MQLGGMHANSGKCLTVGCKLHLLLILPPAAAAPVALTVTVSVVVFRQLLLVFAGRVISLVRWFSCCSYHTSAIDIAHAIPLA